MSRNFGEREAAEEARRMALIVDFLVQSLSTKVYAKEAPWDSRAIAQMSCEIYRKLSES